MEPNKRIVALVDDLYEDLELWYPVIRLREAGFEVILAGKKAGKNFKGKHGLPAKSDIAFEELNESGFDALVIPGGYAPDKLRRNSDVLAFVKRMDEAGKPIGMICHAGWVPISAGILKNRKATSVSAIKDDMINAGANWVDEEVVVDNNLVSSRTPLDLPAYMKQFIEKMK